MARAKRTKSGGHREPLNEESILAAVTKEFATKGYRGANLNDVADHLGVTRQAIYYYFPRKHDLLKVIMISYFEGLERGVDEAAQLGGTPAEKFLRMLRVHFEWLSSRPTETTVFMREEDNLPKSERDNIAARRLRHQRKFVEAYKAAIAADEFVPLSPGLVVSTLLGAGNWSYRWFKPDGRLSPHQYADFATMLLRDGFAKEPGTEHQSTESVDFQLSRPRTP